MLILYINTPAKVNILRNFGKIMHLSLDFFGKGCIIIISNVTKASARRNGTGNFIFTEVL